MITNVYIKRVNKKNTICVTITKHNVKNKLKKSKFNKTVDRNINIIIDRLLFSNHNDNKTKNK